MIYHPIIFQFVEIFEKILHWLPANGLSKLKITLNGWFNTNTKKFVRFESNSTACVDFQVGTTNQLDLFGPLRYSIFHQQASPQFNGFCLRVPSRFEMN